MTWQKVAGVLNACVSLEHADRKVTHHRYHRYRDTADEEQDSMDSQDLWILIYQTHDNRNDKCCKEATKKADPGLSRAHIRHKLTLAKRLTDEVSTNVFGFSNG